VALFVTYQPFHFYNSWRATLEYEATINATSLFILIFHEDLPRRGASVVSDSVKLAWTSMHIHAISQPQTFLISSLLCLGFEKWMHSQYTSPGVTYQPPRMYCRLQICKTRS
jgi:predicted Na+-dependent transporter